jgi:hypothetical protein
MREHGPRLAGLHVDEHQVHVERALPGPENRHQTTVA